MYASLNVTPFSLLKKRLLGQTQHPDDARRRGRSSSYKSSRTEVSVAHIVCFLCSNGSSRPVLSHVVTGPTDSALPADTESTHIITVSYLRTLLGHIRANVFFSGRGQAARPRYRWERCQDRNVSTRVVNT